MKKTKIIRRLLGIANNEKRKKEMASKRYSTSELAKELFISQRHIRRLIDKEKGILPATLVSVKRKKKYIIKGKDIVNIAEKVAKELAETKKIEKISNPLLSFKERLLKELSYFDIDKEELLKEEVIEWHIEGLKIERWEKEEILNQLEKEKALIEKYKTI